MTKQVSVRIVAEGGQELKAQFVGIGQEGEEAFRKIGRMSKSAEASAEVFTRAIAAEERQLEQLRASIDPLYRSSMQYSNALNRINEALAKGMVTQAQATRMTELAGQAYLGVGEGIDQVGKAAGSRQYAMRNLAFQLNQIGQQGAVTGDYLAALSIQLPDILTSFGFWGIMIGGATAVMGPWLISLLKAEDQAKSLKDQLDELSTAMSELRSATSAANQPLTEMMADYGRFSAQAAEVLAIQREIANLEAQVALTNTASQISESFGELTGKVMTLSSAFSFLSTDGFAVADMRADAFQQTIKELGRRLDISPVQATALAEALRAIGDAQGPADQAEALRLAHEQILLAAGGLGEMDAETRSVYRALLDAELAARRLASIDMRANIGAAADEAGRLADNIYAAMSAEFAARPDAVAGGRGGDPRQFESDPYWRDRYLPDPYRSRKTRSRRGGSSAQKEMNDLLREAERIYEATRTDAERYNAEIAKADQLLDQGLITYETYTRHVADLREELANAEGWNTVQEGIDGIADAAADALVNGESLRDGLRGVFKGIAHDLAQAGIRQMLVSIFNPGGLGGGGGILGSLFGAFLPTFDGGGDTGSGPRAGGLDGKGGYLAMLHPQETVIDRTRGQGGGTVINIDARGAQQGVAEQIEAALIRHMPQIEGRVIGKVSRRMRTQPKSMTGLSA